MTRRSVPVWTLLGVAAVVALLVGSGAFSSSPQSPAQRAQAIDATIRCPSCEDLSVADSSAPTAVAVRGTVLRLVEEGRSDQQVVSYLTARYGQAIALDPPASGWSLLVWLLPVVGGAVAVAVLGLALYRRRTIDGDDPGPAAGADDLDEMTRAERTAFLERSLADADAEYLAGDLSDRDYLALRQRDLTRLAALRSASAGDAPSGAQVGLLERASTAPVIGGAEIAEDAPTPATTERPDPAAEPAAPAEHGEPAPVAGRNRRRSRWFLAAAVAAFGAAAVVGVAIAASHRLPGQTATGTVSLSQSRQVAQTLAQAATAEDQGQLGEAAQLYQSVLDAQPGNEPALAQLGWLEVETGTEGASASLLADGRAKLERAVALAPGDFAARLYLGTLLLQHDGNAAGAVAQFRAFLADRPPASVESQAASVVRTAFQKAGQPVPAQVAG